MRKIVCEVCGKEFEVSQAGRFVYCSNACRVQARREQHKQYKERTYGGMHRSWECQKASRAAEERARAEAERKRKERAEYEAEARKMGMNYGMYTALMEMKKQDEQRNRNLYCRGR